MRTRPDVTSEIQLPRGSVVVDGHGYLVDPEDWSIEFAQFVAQNEGITLEQTHWDVIDYMRNSYFDQGVAVDVRHVNKYMGAKLGGSKNDGRRKMFELFPYGYVKQACKIAGMKQPRAWSTG